MSAADLLQQRHVWEILAALVFAGTVGGGAPRDNGITYPEAPRLDLTDEHHGVKVPDPYRWLEQTDSEQTRKWIEAQNKIAYAYLEKIPKRQAIKDRLTALWNFERYGIPHKEGGRYFFSKNDGLQNQSVLYTAANLDGTPRVLLDPNTLSKDGTVALTSDAVSEDGRYLAYGTAEAGSDWNVLKVRDVATGKDLPDLIRWVKFSRPSWTKDGKGFFYSRFKEPVSGAELKDTNRFHKIYLHKLGTAQADDLLVYERPDKPDWYMSGEVTEDGKYLIISANENLVKDGIFYKDLSSPSTPVVELLNKFDAQYRFVGNDGPAFWIMTDREAPRWQLVAIDTRKPEPENWKPVIPQAAEAIQEIEVVGERFIVSYLKDAMTVVRVHDLAGKYLRDIDLPGIGTATGFGGKRKDPETFYSFTSYTAPGRIYRYDVASNQSHLFREPKVKFNPDDYTTRQVFYNSKDGTRVPMLIVHRKPLKLDGTNPALLYGYGGFSISITPAFSVAALAWMEMGGVYAVPNLRGGGEYGEQWHQAGMKTKKQNVFDDFIAAAEWLIANKYTSSKKLAIHGASNGGLLVGACMTQRPDLFGACLPAVGVLDMLRFHKFTVGWAWVGDYGSAEDAAEFKALYAYSPYHNVKRGTCYPKTLITTADHDDRVFPAHSFKFAAALQWAQGCENPVLIRIETRAGHGLGKPTSKRIEETADMWAFLVRGAGNGPAARPVGGR